MVFNSQFWEWIWFHLEIQSLCIISGRNKERESSKIPELWDEPLWSLPSSPILWFWETPEELILQHFVSWWRWDPSTFRKLVLLLIPKHSCLWTQNKLFISWKIFLCLGSAVSVQRSQLWNKCRTLRFFLFLMSLVLDTSQPKERILFAAQNIGKSTSHWFSLLLCVAMDSFFFFFH